MRHLLEQADYVRIDHFRGFESYWEIPADASEEMIADYAKQVASEFTYGSNMRGSAEYRQHLTEVLLRREMSSILAEGR